MKQIMSRIYGAKYIALCGIVLVGSGCASGEVNRLPRAATGTAHIQTPLSNIMRERISFETKDSIQIIGDYEDAGRGAPTVLLLHMMPATRVSWQPFMEKLRAAGISSLAIDFRGHGESIRRIKNQELRIKEGVEVLNYKNFSDKEQQEKILDVRAAIEWLLLHKGLRKEDVYIVGASIGANLALQYQTENPEIRRTVLLSPGLDYRGIQTDTLITKLGRGQKVLLVASADDDDYSLETIREIHRLNSSQTEVREEKNIGHGTTMFLRKPELMDEVVKWLGSN